MNLDLFIYCSSIFGKSERLMFSCSGSGKWCHQWRRNCVMQHPNSKFSADFLAGGWSSIFWGSDGVVLIALEQSRKRHMGLAMWYGLGASSARDANFVLDGARWGLRCCGVVHCDVLLRLVLENAMLKVPHCLCRF